MRMKMLIRVKSFKRIKILRLVNMMRLTMAVSCTRHWAVLVMELVGDGRNTAGTIWCAIRFNWKLQRKVRSCFM